MQRFSIGRAIAFTYYLGKLIDYASTSGIDIMCTELQRFKDRQQQLVDAGSSQTLDSDHIVCSACDVDVIRGGKVVGDGSDHAYRELAQFWTNLNNGCYWLGPEDARHFGYRH